MGKSENVEHPPDGAALGVRINRRVMRRDGRLLMADDVHHDGTVYAGIFQDGGRGVPQAVKRLLQAETDVSNSYRLGRFQIEVGSAAEFSGVAGDLCCRLRVDE